MAIIKNLAFYQKSALKNLASFVGYDFFATGFISFPFDLINNLVPLRLKFSQETFVLIDDNKIKGLISLEKEKGNFRKLKTNKFFLDSDSFVLSEQLVNYAISRFCANGATSFQVIVDESYSDVINLFVNASKFRISAQELIYKIERSSYQDTLPNYFEIFHDSDANNVCDLYNSVIFSYLLPVFEKKENYFKGDILNNNTSFKFIFKDSESDKIYGYFSISTSDNFNYMLDFVIDPCFNSYFLDIVHFVNSQILKRNKDFNLYLRIKKYFSNSDDIVKILDEHKAKLVRKNFVLTKDFFIPAKEFKSNKILFDALSTSV